MTALGLPVVSRVPGRLRLRDPALRVPRYNAALVAELCSWEAMLQVEGNPRTGSVLLQYDSTRLSPEMVDARLRVLLTPASCALQPDTSPSPAGTEAGDNETGGEERALSLWRFNRPAKIGMLASLSASLLALTFGRKPHAVFGGLFLSFLLVHLANHRKKLVQ